jgi:protein-S-isoprenylcysteine O-methyltransferase Ste14
MITKNFPFPSSAVPCLSDAVFFFRFSLFALVHSLLALPSLKVWIVGQNRHLARCYRLYYNMISLVMFSWLMAAIRGSAVLYVAPGVWSLVLYAIQLFALLQLFVCLRQTGMAAFLGISHTPDDAPETSRLITTGWYRIVRHPLYLLSLLFLICNPVITSFGLLFTLLAGGYFLLGACLEERRLLAEFGSEYREYQHRVPFILPRIFRRTPHFPEKA